MLIKFENEIQKIRDIRAGKIKEGLRFGHMAIDEWFRFKRSAFTIIMGHANVGKTHVAFYLMLLLSIRHGLKFLIYSSENETYSLIIKLIEFLEGKPINKIQESHFQFQYQWINEHFMFLNPNVMHTYKSLLKEAKKIYIETPYDGFLIDPYNSLIKDRDILKGINSHEYDYQAATEMRIFCHEHDVSIWLNSHVVTEALRKKHGSSEYFAGHSIPPMMSDIEGGGKWGNRATDVICCHRYTQHESDWMYTFLHVRKIKETSSGGRPTPLDMPIRLKSIINNVGFEVNGQNMIKYPKREQKKLL
jgi:replicative DNA helicase